MPDMLVNLLNLPRFDEQAIIGNEGITIRRAICPEKRIVIDWVRETFSPAWADECEIAFTRQPVSCFIATDEQKLMGFACHECTAKNFFGPTGVSEEARGKGVGRALLLRCMDDMRATGYVYAIIGGVGPADFYSKTVGATIIPDSTPGIYRGILSE